MRLQEKNKNENINIVMDQWRWIGAHQEKKTATNFVPLANLNHLESAREKVAIYLNN